VSPPRVVMPPPSPLIVAASWALRLLAGLGVGLVAFGLAGSDPLSLGIGAGLVGAWASGVALFAAAFARTLIGVLAGSDPPPKEDP
jgi:hypothetical protein